MTKSFTGYIGTNDDELIFNDDHYKVVFGRHGNDTIVDSQAGDDLVNNIYRGMDDNDTIVTYAGHDFLRGGSGDDTFFSYNTDNFHVTGGAGHDVLNIVVDDPSQYQDLVLNGEKMNLQVDDHFIHLKKIEEVHFVDHDHGWHA